MEARFVWIIKSLYYKSCQPGIQLLLKPKNYGTYSFDSIDPNYHIITLTFHASSTYNGITLFDCQFIFGSLT